MQLPVYTPEYHYVDFDLFNQYNDFVAKSFGSDFKSKLILTFDTELFGKWTKQQEDEYPYVLTSIAEILKNNRSSASFCLLLEDGNQMKKTPAKAVNGVIDHLGTEALELHGFHHNIKTPDHYSYQWFRDGIDAMSSRYGKIPKYIAQPSWVWNDASSIMLASFNEIYATRGIQSGPNFYKRVDFWPEFNFKFPYRYFGKIQFPYQYIDWKYYDFFGNRLQYNALNWHKVACDITKKSGPCFMETIAHPFRLTCGDVDKNLEEFDNSIKNYINEGFDIISSSQAIDILSSNKEFMSIGDLLLIAQGHQPNLQQVKHAADLPRVESNTLDYVRSMGS